MVLLTVAALPGPVRSVQVPVTDVVRQHGGDVFIAKGKTAGKRGRGGDKSRGRIEDARIKALLGRYEAGFCAFSGKFKVILWWDGCGGFC